MVSGPALIISFYYPPYPKVGSRRWVKFAKYLNRHRKEVYVLAAQMDVDKKSPWDDDAKEVEHLTTRLHFKYSAPYYKTHTPSSVGSKVRWHLSKWQHQSTKTKALPGNPSDISEVYAPEFLKAAKKIIEEKYITTVIFTASPNHLAYHISTLKKEYPKVKFIFDLRDYWSDWMLHLDKPQYEYERHLEEQTIQNSDIIFSPAKKILDTLKLRYVEKAPYMKLLLHAFDNDDFTNATKNSIIRKDADNIHLVYAGTMYENMESNMVLLSELLAQNPKVRLTFYTFTQDYKEFFANLSERVNYVKPLPVKEFTVKMQQEADALLYMRSTLNDDNNFLSSKFFDFLPLKKPIAYLGSEGDALEFLTNEKIGFHLNKTSIHHIEELIIETNQTIHQFNVSEHSFDAVTKQLEAELER